ncbi:hypothetical protein ACOMHN_052718 [Nucella lapillus]
MMQTNKYRCLFTVVPRLVCVHPDLASCTTAFTDSLKGSVLTHKEQFCTVLRTYRSCIAGICEDIPKDMMDYMVKAQTHYNFDCGIAGGSVMVTPPSLLFLLSAILPTILLY